MKSIALALTIFAASDLGPAFKEIVPQFERQTGSKATLVLGSTGTLAQQIRNGAPADLFYAASESHIQDLASDGLVLLHTRALYARGRIVTVTLESTGIHIADLKDLMGPRVRRIAMANPAHAPYGLAAQQALQTAGLWESVRAKLVYGENVQQAVQFVQSGAADAGLVARSVADAPDLEWKLVDEKLHAPLNQMAAVLARTTQPDLATSFIAFVNGPHGRLVLRKLGFLVPGEPF